MNSTSTTQIHQIGTWRRCSKGSQRSKSKSQLRMNLTAQLKFKDRSLQKGLHGSSSHWVACLRETMKIGAGIGRSGLCSWQMSRTITTRLRQWEGEWRRTCCSIRARTETCIKLCHRTRPNKALNLLVILKRAWLISDATNGSTARLVNSKKPLTTRIYTRSNNQTPKITSPFPPATIRVTP